MSSVRITTLVTRQKQHRNEIGSRCMNKVRETVSAEMVSWISYYSHLESEEYTRVTAQQPTYPGNEESSSRRIKGSLTQPQLHMECSSESLSKGDWNIHSDNWSNHKAIAGLLPSYSTEYNNTMKNWKEWRLIVQNKEYSQDCEYNACTSRSLTEVLTDTIQSPWKDAQRMPSLHPSLTAR